MGEVYLARDLRLHRDVAIKLLRAGAVTGQSEKLLGEARHLARLNHPNIVQVYDVLETGDGACIVMEYVEDGNLFRRLREQPPDAPTALAWLTDVATALRAAHKQGITHNDLKPENIFLSRDGSLKVGDFGIASEQADVDVDWVALRELAYRLCPDRDHLSPLAKHAFSLLESAASDSLEAVAAGFREAWLESQQQETQPDQALESGPVYRRSAALAFALLLVLAVSISWWRYDGERLLVAVSDPVLYFADEAAPSERYAMTTTIRESLAQQALTSADISLVRLTRVERSLTVAQGLLSATGATEAVVSSVDCSADVCELLLERVGSRGEVIAQVAFPVRRHTPLETFALIGEHWPALFGGDRRGDWQPAINSEDYQRYLDLHRRSQLGEGDQEDVLQAIEGLLSKAAQFPPLYELYTHAALEMYDQTGDISYLDKVENLLNSAALALGESEFLLMSQFKLDVERGDFAAAESHLDRLADLSRDTYQISKLTADLHAARGDYAIAASFYERAAAARPNRSLLYNMATTYYFSGDRQAAADALDQSLALYPADAGALDLLGLITLEQGLVEQAVAHLRASLALQFHTSTVVNLGLAYMIAGDYEQSMNALLMAVEQGSEEPVLLLNLADALQLAGRREAALGYYQTLVSKWQRDDPQVPDWLAAQAFAQLGQHSQALSVLAAMSDAERRHSDGSFSSALVNTLAEQYLAALVEVDRALAAELAPVWFSLPVFDPLCESPVFAQRLADAGLVGRCRDVVSYSVE